MAAALIPTSQISPQVMESVLLEGDLSRLQPADRVSYYRSVCESVGLNPLTRPLEYLKLNGKLTLYAKRDCTDQLRAIHAVSVTIPSREIAEGCYVVTARASMPSGRQDESIGAVPIDGLKGEARSNALMKAETKAKRRVTLAICGLSYLDESELESVKGAVRMAVSDQGEIAGPMPGSIEAAQEVARRKIEQMTPREPQPAAAIIDELPEYEYQEPPAADEDAELDRQLKESIYLAERMQPRKNPNRFDMLKAFSQMKTRFRAIGFEHTYYSFLGMHGVRHSNEFPSTEEGLTEARHCYKRMSMDVANREVKGRR